VSKASKRERQRLNREARRQYEESLAKRRRTMKGARRFAIFAVPVIALVVVLNISGGDSGKSAAVVAGCREVKKAPKPKTATFKAAPPLTIDTAKRSVATVDTSCGSFTIELAVDQGPQTVNSFVFLAQQGFYDGLTFHRVQKDFVVQGGDPNGDGSGGPGYTLPDEPPVLGYQKGSVAMANAGPNTTGSQFYIITTDKGAEALNKQVSSAGRFSYSILGQVTDGFDTILRINKLGSTNPDPGKQKPKAIVLIDKVTISEPPPDTTPST
jgi:cyclophilin family peptidyl-prolyl cis-trans isomerase